MKVIGDDVRRKPHLGSDTGPTPTRWPLSKATGRGNREDKHFSRSGQELRFLGGKLLGGGAVKLPPGVPQDGWRVLRQPLLPSGYLPPSTASWRNRSAGKCSQNGRPSIERRHPRCHVPLTGAQRQAGASFALCCQRGKGRSYSSPSRLAGQVRRL